MFKSIKALKLNIQDEGVELGISCRWLRASLPRHTIKSFELIAQSTQISLDLYKMLLNNYSNFLLLSAPSPGMHAFLIYCGNCTSKAKTYIRCWLRSIYCLQLIIICDNLLTFAFAVGLKSIRNVRIKIYLALTQWLTFVHSESQQS